MLLEIDNINQVLVVDPNILIKDLNKKLSEEALVFLPTLNQLYLQLRVVDLFHLKLPNPSHHLYGTIFNFALGATFETNFGGEINLDKKVLKCASGYDFTRFLLGFKDLAFPKKIILRIHPKKEKIDFNFFLEDITQLVNLCSTLKKLKYEPFSFYLIRKKEFFGKFIASIVVEKKLEKYLKNQLNFLNIDILESNEIFNLDFPNEEGLIKKIKLNKTDFVSKTTQIENIVKDLNINCYEILFPLIGLCCLIFKNINDLKAFERVLLQKFQKDKTYYYDLNSNYKIDLLKKNILNTLEKNNLSFSDFKSQISYSDFKRELEKVIDKKYITDNLEDLYLYSYDATFKSSLPDVVVFAKSTEQISRVLNLAFKHYIPVTCRGAGSNLSGGSVPLKGGISLVLTQMNRIIELDLENYLAVVEPGVVTKDLADLASKSDLFYPPDPASSAWCTLGGNVSECAGGPMCFKYGVTRDYVEFIEVVLSDGSIINVDAFQNPEILSLFIGSEGTLGIFTKVGLRLLRKPEARELFLINFKDLEDAAACINDIISLGIVPKTFEIMDRTAIDIVKEYVFFDLSIDTNALLILEVDGTQKEVESLVSTLKNFLTLRGLDFILAKNSFEMNKIWDLRKAISPACGKIAPTKISEDATVPRSKIVEMIRGINSIAKKYSLKIIIFGHAGDGNLHPNILTDKRNKEEMKRVQDAIGEIFELALKLGGTLSGEHGIGYMKAPYIELEFDKSTIELAKAIKFVFDPKNILNPKKIFLQKP
ncbi:D-lactate dehydrogenase (cytochrome) [Thermodesulfobium narugense DSM 14796]|uniref:D-lactate dehydrogenase (Cytochrome) n=1 Tax=Thermodesulfobium narugense DSM 14796 TaxID=747365 RepID=M1E439_9BACT|nr:FAD-linked oxidase C-terminal domain-containing protein [Thermodesulfobium narugense]AEE13702.1 D-lactate dehydrogenase (cytochrome) [Thermodesulfobium narugense DSM 14796]